MNARAYTVGRDVVFSEGGYAPHLRQGSKLLAHELAHVIQQGRGGPPPPLSANAPHERAADHAANRAMSGQMHVAVAGATGVGVARDEDEEKRISEAPTKQKGPVPPKQLRNTRSDLKKIKGAGNEGYKKRQPFAKDAEFAESVLGIYEERQGVAERAKLKQEFAQEGPGGVTEKKSKYPPGSRGNPKLRRRESSFTKTLTVSAKL